MKYYPLYYRLNRKKRWLIWISNETDSVVIDRRGFVPTFPNRTFLRRYATVNNLRLEWTEKAVLCDLDWVVSWSKAPSMHVDCRKALDAWNLFHDVVTSIPKDEAVFRRLDSRFPSTYDKLFWGSNLPTVTPRGKKYIPEWSQQELGSLARVLRAGLKVFVSSTQNWPQ